MSYFGKEPNTTGLDAKCKTKRKHYVHINPYVIWLQKHVKERGKGYSTGRSARGTSKTQGTRPQTQEGPVGHAGRVPRMCINLSEEKRRKKKCL